MSKDFQTPLHKEYLSVVQEICAAEPMAYRWFEQVMDAALLWDHVIDDDPIDKTRADAAFHALTIEWINNDWFYRNRAFLTPVLMNAITAWRAQDSYYLYTELPGVLALIFKGTKGADEYGRKIRHLIEREKWEDLRRDSPPFFILGLPRSRTAWLAAFLTDGPVHCHHELIRQCANPDEYLVRLAATRTPIVGDSSPALALYYPSLREAIGRHKVVVIRRNKDEARLAHEQMLIEAKVDVAKYQEGWPKAEEAFETAARLAQEFPSYKYADLDDQRVMCELTQYCTGQPFNEERWKLFDELKITAMPAKVIANQRILP